MASKLESFFFKKNEGWMNQDHFINYKSQRSFNKSFFSLRSKRETNNVRFCLVKGDILNIDVSCIVNFYEHGKKSKNSIFKKAGKFYEDHFNNKLLKILPTFSIKNYSLFLSLSGEMTNCEYILNLIYKSKKYSGNIRERDIFLTIFEIYCEIIETANASKLKSLAIPFVIIDNELEISIKALIQAIIFATESSNCIYQSLKYIYLISDDDEILKKCDNLATNGFDLEYIILKDQKQINSTVNMSNQKNKANKTIILNKTENFVNFYNNCGVCKKNSLLLSNFLEDKFLENCSNLQRKCKICIISKQIALFYRKNGPIDSDTFCIYCVGNLIDNKKDSLCSSCLRIADKTQMKKNKYCNKDLLCLKCSNLPQNVKNCYVCEFFVLLQKLEENEMILNHGQFLCCFDYCDLSKISFENIKHLSCGHTSCLKIIGMSRLCSLCSIKKLIDSLNQ